MPSGRSLVTAALMAAAFTLFVPAFAEASESLSYDWWQYGPQLGLVLEHLPLILALTAVVVLAYPFTRGFA